MELKSAGNLACACNEQEILKLDSSFTKNQGWDVSITGTKNVRDTCNS